MRSGLRPAAVWVGSGRAVRRVLGFAAGRFALAVRVCALALGASASSVLASDLPRPDADGSLRLTLSDAVGLALERNRGFLNRRAARGVQRLSLSVAEDRWTPRFAVGPFASQAYSDRDRSERRVGGGAETRLRVPTGGALALRWEEARSDVFGDSRRRSLSFSQPLLKGAWFSVEGAPVRVARIEERIGILSLRGAAADLVVSAVGAYRALTGAVRRVEIAEAALRRARDQLRATRALVRAGRVARREAVRFEAAIANREVSVARTRNDLDAANLALVGLLALEDTVRVRPLGSLAVERRAAAHGAVLDEALRRRPDFREAELRVEMARIGLLVARDGLLPDVSVGLEVSRADAGPTDTLVRLGAAIPLNDPEPELARVRARTALRQAERGLTELRASIGIAVRRAVNDATVGLRLTELAGAARALAESNLEVERRKFGEGLASSFEVAGSEDELLRAEQAEVDAIVAYLEALTRLDRVSGRTLERWNVRLETVPP